MSKDLAVVGGRDVDQYDPQKGLETIAVAESAEKSMGRALGSGKLAGEELEKTRDKLNSAVDKKIENQAKYVVWRDGVARPAHRPKKSFRTESVLPAADPGDVVAHRWRKRLCIKDKQGTRIDPSMLAIAKEEARHRSQRACEFEGTGTERGTSGTGEIELYTPARYIEAARQVLGEIDLDPASNDIAQKTVQAAKYFTAETNGLKRQWKGRVWLNPPYHRKLLPEFINKMVEEVDAKRVTAAIMLTNNATDTEWFARAYESCNAICFTKGRIGFIRPNGLEVSPTQGQAFFYFGQEVESFESVFFKIGFGMIPKWDFDEEAK